MSQLITELQDRDIRVLKRIRMVEASWDSNQPWVGVILPTGTWIKPWNRRLVYVGTDFGPYRKKPNDSHTNKAVKPVGSFIFGAPASERLLRTCNCAALRPW